MIKLQVEGAERTSRAFRSLGLKSRDLSAAFGRIGAEIARDAVVLAPVGETGRLAASIRAGKAKTRATVSAGYARTPYAGVINYGWPARRIAPSYFLNDALEDNADTATREVFSEMQRLIKSVGLK